MMIHYNLRHQSADADRDSAGLDAGAVVNAIDPDLFFDELPQPFRFINKTIESLISSACDQVDSAMLAQARSMRLSKQQLADLSCLEQVEEEHEIASATTPLYPIGGSLLLFFSEDQNLILWDSCEMSKLDALPMGEQTVLKVESFEVSPTRFLVVVLTQKADQSTMTIVGVLNSKLHVLTQQEISIQDSIASDCLISPRAEYLMVSHSANDDVRCVEIYTLQSDAWFRALDAALIAAANAAANPNSPVPAQVPGVPASVTSEAPSIDSVAVSVPASVAPTASLSQHTAQPTGQPPSQQGEPTGGHPGSIAGSNQPGTTAPSVAGTVVSAQQSNALGTNSVPPQSVVPPPSESERPKIPTCPLTLRFKYPLLGACLPLSQFVKASETADGLCLGTNNLFSSNYLSLRQNLHKSRQSQFMPLGIADRLPDILNVYNVTPPKRAPLSAWLSDSKFVIAWPEVCSLVVCSAVKPPPPQIKGAMQTALITTDQTEGKPESSWPLSSPVIALSTSPNRQLLGVLLESGNLLVLNSGNFVNSGNVFSWLVSATLSVSPKPSSVKKFSVIETDRIILETSAVLPSTAPNYAALIRYQESPANMNVLWKFNSLDIGSEFAFVEMFEQWPSVVFLGLPDGALLLCERDSFKKTLITLRLPEQYNWPWRESSTNMSTLRLTSDGRVLFALGRYEAIITSSVDGSNKLFRFDLVSNLPAWLVSRWNPTGATSGKMPPPTTPKPSITAIANQVVKQSVCAGNDTADRLKLLWAEERDRNKDSRN